MTVSRRRTAAYDFGLLAETAAALFLQIKGYRILARRYKTLVGEIDIVAEKRGALIAVEVKARNGKTEALEAVRTQTKHRVGKALLHFVARHPHYAGHGMRYDVIAVYRGRMVPLRILHLDNAWQGHT